MSVFLKDKGQDVLDKDNENHPVPNINETNETNETRQGRTLLQVTENNAIEDENNE